MTLVPKVVARAFQVVEIQYGDRFGLINIEMTDGSSGKLDGG